VLDTSVLVAALRSSAGAAAENVRLALLQELTLLMDYKLACEYRDVALRAEQLTASGKTEEETVLVLDMLEAVAEPVLVVTRYAPLSQDANDDLVFDVAINGHAQAIVTHNIRHFREVAKRFAIDVLTPAELLHALRTRR
jgi:predicted nucleic acid-binding protein